ncbi:cysteine desulfurase family protein [Capnocytophaga sputigena]|jgi:cysteine desulfurase|uniref:cysteine desulfurase family protein n=1 Tax=Capnocytophaga sputigena TaxID=1019 RepID=UPI002889C8F9|nr:cysteine desulfurase family protein [Capnocytophaga sputigena]
MKVYFDNAATTPLYPEVVEKITEVLSNTYGNPSSTHALGRGAKSLIEYSRKQIAKELNALPSEIIFTSGGTEADNFILHSCVRDLGVQVVISSLIEHHAVLHTLEVLAKEYPIQIVYVNLTERGDIDLQHLKNLLEQYTEKKVLVSLMHLNNEIGNILPLKEVATLCKEKGAYFHSDTVQSVGHYPINLQEIPVDFITASAHKFHGPKGVGFAFIRKGIVLHSIITGGEQEKGLRAGTEAVHNIAGMEVAFNLCYKNLDKNTEKLKNLKQYFIHQLKHHFPEIVFNGTSESLEESSYAIVNVGFPALQHQDNTLLFQLDLKGIACSKGSACQSGSVQVSHVLSAFMPKEALQYPSLRFSFSAFNTIEEVDFLIESLKEISLNKY